MAKKIKIKKQDIIDWFIIQRIRFLNFVREHKYVSAVVGVFLLSCIAYLIVFASQSDPYENKVSADITSITTKNVNSSAEITQIDSFSTLVYDISYKLTVEEPPEEGLIRNYVELTAHLEKDIDAEWIIYSSETTEAKVSEDGKTLTLKLYSVKVGELNTKQLYLKVNNVKGDSDENSKEIVTKIDIKEATMTVDSSTATGDSEEIGTSVKETNEVALTYELVGGTAYNSEFCETGRCTPFGIVLGIDKSKLINDSLSGLYFNPEININMSARDNLGNQLNLLTSASEYGLFTESHEEIIKGMPKLSFNSATLELGLASNLEPTQSSSTIKTPEISLVGAQIVNLKIGEEYEEEGVTLETQEDPICTNYEEEDCEITIKNSSGEKVDEISTESERDYTIYYKLFDENHTASVTLKRIVKVSGSKQILEDFEGNKYQLYDNDEIVVIKGEEYEVFETFDELFEIVEEPELLNDEVGAENSDDDGGDMGGSEEEETPLDLYIEITKDDEDYELQGNISDETGEYKVKYYIIDDEGEERSVVRTIKVVENTKVKSLSASESYVVPAGANIANVVKAKLAEQECSDCKIEYYDVEDTNFENPKTSINTTEPKTYKIKFIYDKDNVLLEVISEISFSISYNLKITDFKINDAITLYENMAVFGTYFITANSVRPEENKNDITVTLNAGEKNATVINPNFSAGTKNNSLEFYSDDTGELIKHSEKAALAYGENVIIKSGFDYLKDGDNNLDTVSNVIDFSKFELSKLNYDSETTLGYYLSINGKRIVSINEDNTLKYLDGEDEQGNPIYNDIEDITFEIEVDGDDTKINGVTYNLTNVAPGTKVDFRLRLKVGIDDTPENKITVTSSATFEQEGNDDSTLESKEASIFITPFKARTELLINNSNYDVIINGAAKEEQVSTWTIYPSLSLPAELINTNSVNIKEVDTVKIIVNLPKGINYIYNENYQLPDNFNEVLNAQDAVQMVYTLNGLNVNEWIDPIIFETNYDVDIKSGDELSVSTIIDATTKDGIKDISDEKLRTTIRKVTYQNNEEIASSVYTSSTAVSKDTEFDINTKLYKNTNTDYDGLQLITVLPNNEITNGSKFNGFYTLDDISSEALCTDTQNITEQDLLNDEIWSSCEDYSENEYEGVTAIKYIDITLNSDSKYFENTFKIVPIDNATDDNYVIESYLINSANIKKLPDLSVNVISKKITGIVWEDFDANGIMTSDEKKLPDIVMNLYDAETNELLSSTVTDATGKYTLSDVSVGAYYIVAEYNTSKYGFTTPFVGNNKSINSSFDSVEKEEMAIGDDETVPEGDDNSLEDNEEENEDDNEDENQVEEEENESGLNSAVVRTNIININENTKIVSNVNLGLALKKIYSIKVDKYITKAYVTNALGVTETKDFGKATLAKLDVKDINNLKIKVVYTIELENIGYYPGYVYKIKDYIPEGMEFNPGYEENIGWVLNEDGYVENSTLIDELIYEGDKKYLNLAFDITRREAGSFVNFVKVEDDDLQILAIGDSKGNEGE